MLCFSLVLVFEVYATGCILFPCLVAASDIFTNFFENGLCFVYIASWVFDEEGHDSVSIIKKIFKFFFFQLTLDPFT